MALTIGISRLLAPVINTPPIECGGRQLFLATSARFPPRQGGAANAGVPLDAKVAVARGTNGQMRSGMYSVDHKSGVAPPQVEKLLVTFREDGTAGKVWDHVAADFKRITGAELAP